MTNEIRLTIVMPCSNDGGDARVLHRERRLGIQRSGVRSETLVSDNGSKDNSVLTALEFGARVVHVRKKGCGNALCGGIQAASADAAEYDAALGQAAVRAAK
jgi:glycosyltransferase involved in cell wall biosynthesis